MKTLDKLREQVECLYLGKQIERFSYDLEMKTREQNRNRWSFFTFIYNRSSKMNYFIYTSHQNRNNKRTEIQRFDWFIERVQTQNFMPENFLEIKRYFALTSCCNKIGQSNNAFSILGFSSMFWSFHPLADKTNVEHLPKPFFKVIRKSLYENFDPSDACKTTPLMRKECDVACISVVFLRRQVELLGVKIIELFLRSVLCCLQFL